jgi:type II secretory pathway predicted ATPase ExeA
VLIVEAHLLTVEQLEQLRLLTNTDMDSRSSLGLVLLGQPTLRRRLKRRHFAALDQRIGLRFHLDGLPLAETTDYIAHHFTLAGRSDPLFSDDAIALIHQTSRGIPERSTTSPSKR